MQPLQGAPNRACPIATMGQAFNFQATPPTNRSANHCFDAAFPDYPHPSRWLESVFTMENTIIMFISTCERKTAKCTLPERKGARWVEAQFKVAYHVAAYLHRVMV